MKRGQWEDKKDRRGAKVEEGREQNGESELERKESGFMRKSQIRAKNDGVDKRV